MIKFEEGEIQQLGLFKAATSRGRSANIEANDERRVVTDWDKAPLIDTPHCTCRDRDQDSDLFF
jgi:hypothetical protein